MLVLARNKEVRPCARVLVEVFQGTCSGEQQSWLNLPFSLRMGFICIPPKVALQSMYNSQQVGLLPGAL